MVYAVRHLTRFRYTEPVEESMMELRMQPRTEGTQRCLSFRVTLRPRANVFSYRDYLGNTVHHFDFPAPHRSLAVLAEALVEQQDTGPIPETLEPSAWAELDAATAMEDYWEMLTPSFFVKTGSVLDQIAEELGAVRREDPLTVVRDINRGLYGWLDYVKNSTRVDSPIDEALESRAGVCQDYAHIMIGLVRRLEIPCRYVSGYLFHGETDRSTQGATHAWVEAFLPGLGWTGFDPTNNALVGTRHLRTAIGRDYADVPPTRGIYKGSSEGELTVSVRVVPSSVPVELVQDNEEGVPEPFRITIKTPADARQAMHQQQQQ